MGADVFCGDEEDALLLLGADPLADQVQPAPAGVVTVVDGRAGRLASLPSVESADVVRTRHTLAEGWIARVCSRRKGRDAHGAADPEAPDGAVWLESDASLALGLGDLLPFIETDGLAPGDGPRREHCPAHGWTQVPDLSSVCRRHYLHCTVQCNQSPLGTLVHTVCPPISPPSNKPPPLE